MNISHYQPNLSTRHTVATRLLCHQCTALARHKVIPYTKYRVAGKIGGSFTGDCLIIALVTIGDDDLSVVASGTDSEVLEVEPGSLVLAGL
jgi:hypothetical protein